MPSRLRWWLVFAVCAVGVLVGLAMMTREMLRLEQAELEARAEASHQESLRLALWRMDSWIAPRIAQEAARPHFEYDAYFPQARAYTQTLNTIEAGEVLTPSPLLTYESDLFLLHFRWDADGTVTSPQVPSGNLRELASVTVTTAEHIAAKEALLDDLRALLTSSDGLASALAAADRRLGRPALERDELEATSWQQYAQAPPGARTKLEAQRRSQVSNQAQLAITSNAPVEPAVRVGALVPVWLDEFGTNCGNVGDPISECVMILARRVEIQGRPHVQGIMLGWPALREALLAEIDDLFPEAELRVIRDPADQEEALGRTLASIPLALATTPTLLPAQATGLGPGRGAVILVWIAALIALVAIGFTVHGSLAYAERRSRFASAVTHELRTPLTTFRMYTDMLAGGMVRSEAQRQTYLETLRNESDRLATLVENVLAYARLERGRGPAAPHATTFGALVDRLTPQLRPRVERAGMQLAVEMNGTADTPLMIDEEAVQQIVTNLVENACKYADASEPPEIRLDGELDGDAFIFRVRDHGPGIDAKRSRVIFQPFERGAEAENGGEGAVAPPGVGLGLALARGLARQLGGDLRLVPCAGAGACFELRLPRGGPG